MGLVRGVTSGTKVGQKKNEPGSLTTYHNFANFFGSPMKFGAYIYTYIYIYIYTYGYMHKYIWHIVNEIDAGSD